MKNNINIQNKKAYYDYAILDTYTAGIVLCGSEVKSIKAGNASISNGCFCYFNNNELYLKHAIIDGNEYKEHKLLLNKKELYNIHKDILHPGYAVVPLKIFINHGLIKVFIAVCKGKKEYDKRNAIKDRENKVNINRIMKHYK